MVDDRFWQLAIVHDIWGGVQLLNGQTDHDATGTAAMLGHTTRLSLSRLCQLVPAAVGSDHGALREGGPT